MSDFLFSLLCGLLIMYVCFRMLPHFGGKYWQKVSDSSRCVFRRFIVWGLSSLPASNPLVRNYFGAESQQKLLFVPDADNNPEEDQEISEPALFRFLLNEETLEEFKVAKAEIPDMLDVLKDINKESKITEFETHQSSMGTAKDLKKAVHVFIVFRTTCETDGDHWWSLEKNRDYIVLQRSRNKNNVKDNCYGDPRNKVKSIKEDLVGKGTIKDLFALLWDQKMILEKYNILYSNCQSFVTFISQHITEIGYEYQGFFKYSPPESGRDKKMLDLINILRGRSEWPPLLTLIEMENIDLVDKIIESGKHDINAFHGIFTPLHFAIFFSKTKMVKHLLKDPMNADPTTRDPSGRSALHVAATTTMKEEIFDLLLAHGKVRVDDLDENGQTALHWAASVSNVIAVKKLIGKGANPNIFDKEGLSPLHVAAQQRDGISIIDLLLEAKKVKGMGDVNDQNERGWTALHYAALASNEITAEHLIKKGADANCQANNGDTPLHMAAIYATDMNIIEVLLRNINEGDMSRYRNNKKLFFFVKRNVHGLGEEIGNRFMEKGIEPPSVETDEWTKESEEATGVTRRFVEKGADLSIDLMRIYGRRLAGAKNSQEIDEILKDEKFDINGRDENGQTLLLVAILVNSVNGVRRLLERGADPTIRNNNGFTPIHLAVINSKDSDIFNLLLANETVDINETTSQHRRTALHLAIITSNVTAARFLLSNGANPNAVDKSGFTPLHWAAKNAKDMDMVELLLNCENVDVNCLDNLGRNALDYARENLHGNKERIANCLKEKGASDGRERENKILIGNNEFFKKHMRVFSNRKPRKVDNFLSDDTIPNEDKIARISEKRLVSAIQDSNIESVRLLLKSGAGIRTWGEEEANALHLASQYAKTTDIIDAILETGKFDIDGTDNDGNTPLHYAITGTNVETNLPHLIRKGADPTIANKKNNTPLHMAARNGKTTETISLILENKQVDINHMDVVGMTPLHVAIMAQNVEIARCLLENGADPAIRNNHGDTPFQGAAGLLTDTEVLGLMLGSEKKIEIDEQNKFGTTALHRAIAWSNVTTARFLLSKGANPNVTNEIGNTPLHLAAMFAKCVDIVELLLNHKDVDVNCLDNEGRNAQDFAKYNTNGCSERIAKLLKEKGVVSQNVHSLDDEKAKNEVTSENRVKTVLEKAIIDSDVGTARFLIQTETDISTVTWGEEGLNALHKASIRAKTTEILDVILETGKFNINGRDVNGETPLHHALGAENMTTARHLLKKGADPTISDKNGVTPLHLAAFHSKTTDVISQILKGFIVDISSRNVSGKTALHYAVEASNVTTARYLLKKGADPAIGDNAGITPFHKAAAFVRESDILDLFLANNDKFDIDHRNRSGMTALHLAIKTSNLIAARFLLSKGANPNAVSEHGFTPLHVAAVLAKEMDIVKLLLNHKDVDVNCLDNKGYDAENYAMSNEHGLGEAITNLLREKKATKAVGNNQEPKNFAALVPGHKENSDIKTIRLLIENGQDISALTWGENETNALHVVAANEKTTDLIDVMLENGKFDINGVDNDGWTPLHHAMAFSTKNVSRLIQLGADPNIADKNGITPLHLAAKNEETTELIDVILETEKCNINPVDSDGRTPFHFAINRPDPVTINARRLIKMGADPGIADKNGVTPLHMAARNAKSMDLIELLLNTEKLNVNDYDHNGLTALAYALSNKHGLSRRIIDRLRESGATE